MTKLREKRHGRLATKGRCVMTAMVMTAMRAHQRGAGQRRTTKIATTCQRSRQHAKEATQWLVPRSTGGLRITYCMMSLHKLKQDALGGYGNGFSGLCDMPESVTPKKSTVTHRNSKLALGQHLKGQRAGFKSTTSSTVLATWQLTSSSLQGVRPDVVDHACLV